jgi:formylmethanofuran dehydrogenase subunit E
VTPEEIARFKENPRRLFIEAVMAKDTTTCLVKAAEIHGHFCPGVALGVMAAVRGLWEMDVASVYFDGIMEDLMAVVEVNACFADGIQAVSGCTLGNNSLVYRDLGRLAVTFAQRGRETGVRLRAAPDYRNRINLAAPEFYPLLEKVIVRRAGSDAEVQAFRDQARQAAFSLVQEPLEELLVVETVKPVLPEMAPVKPSQVCPECGEEIMQTKIVPEGENQGLCYLCGDYQYYQVEGRGIVPGP